MLKLCLLYPHLLATCVAIGMIVLTDLRLLPRLLGYRVVIAAPGRFETGVVTGALALLYATGVGLIALGLQDHADYLDNPKLQAKIGLVVVLTLNGLALHRWVFPRLRRGAPVSAWSMRFRLLLSTTVGLSNSVWLYAAFLGIARVWNFQKPLAEVLLLGGLAWAVLSAGIAATLQLASVEAPVGRRRWHHALKERLSSALAPGAAGAR
jgi:hypothetical protein